MDVALYKLLYLRMRGGLRYRLRQLASVRGAMFLVLVAGIIWLLVRAGAASPGEYLGDATLDDPAVFRERIADFMPLGLLAACVFTVFVSSGPAVYFSQNEINFLFTGPFARRDLVLYKILTYFTGAIVSASIITLLIPPRASTLLAGFLGCLMTLLFIQLASAAIRILAQAFEDTRLVRAQRPVIAGLAALAGIAVFYILATTDKTIVDILGDFRHSVPGVIALAPFTVFSELLLSTRLFPELVGWTAVAVVINVALLAVIVALDERTSDKALAANSRLAERWMRIKRGGSMWASDKTTGRSVARAPAFGGLGPIAWRQAINAVRNSGRVILVFLGIAALSGPVLTGLGISLRSSETAGLVYFFIAFILPRTLVCDFRGELARIEHYKGLPIAPWRICTAQLVMPVILSSLIQVVMIASAIAFLDLTTAIIVIAASIFTLPFNLLLYGLENLVFLVFPSKLVPVGRVDFDFLGRTLVDFTAKTIIIVLAVAIARSAGIAAQRITDEPWISFTLTSWLVLTLFGLATIPAMALAFRRFKVSETIE